MMDAFTLKQKHYKKSNKNTKTKQNKHTYTKAKQTSDQSDKTEKS